MIHRYLLALPILLVPCLFVQADEHLNKNEGALKLAARRTSGLPPVGYLDNALIPGQTWRVHDIARPEPTVVTPGVASSGERVGKAPSDAIVLFDGSDLSKWQTPAGEPAAWKVENGYMEVNGTGSIVTKQAFGSCQLHLEWATPGEVERSSQGRGNSGVILMGFYEVQVLDSYNNRTYSDGQAAAIYGQYPPRVNASRGPGQWQTYDIIFERPQFEGDVLIRPTYFTVLHNGVLAHHHVAGAGRVAHKDPPSFAPHEAALPLLLQDHSNPVRFRNVWIRSLE